MKAKRPKTFHNGQGATWTVFTGLPKAMPQGEKNKNPLVGCFTCGIFSNTTSQINPHGASVLKGFKRSYPFFESFKITFHSLESTGTGWIRHTRNDAHPRVIKSALCYTFIMHISNV